MSSYPKLNSHLPFNAYIAACRTMIQDKRLDLHKLNTEIILDANSPFEMVPINPQIKCGVLLIHGLLDCPFTLKDIATSLVEQGILCRAVLLPGHGTIPSDLLNVSYHDWIEAVHYGIQTLKQQVDQIFLIGYSTGAALSIYEAIKDPSIRGLILLSPAIKVNPAVNFTVAYHQLLSLFGKSKTWIYHRPEINYAKYRSIPFQATYELEKFLKKLREYLNHQMPHCPTLMILSEQDETISSEKALAFWNKSTHQHNKLLLYTNKNKSYEDKRIVVRSIAELALPIKHFSHSCLPISNTNIHYGEQGDYINASHIYANGYVYGAYNHLESNIDEYLYKLKLTPKKRRELTYNPDFDFMINYILAFLKMLVV